MKILFEFNPHNAEDNRMLTQFLAMVNGPTETAVPPADQCQPSVITSFLPLTCETAIVPPAGQHQEAAVQTPSTEKPVEPIEPIEPAPEHAAVQPAPSKPDLLKRAKEAFAAASLVNAVEATAAFAQLSSEYGPSFDAWTADQFQTAISKLQSVQPPQAATVETAKPVATEETAPEKTETTPPPTPSTDVRQQLLAAYLDLRKIDSVKAEKMAAECREKYGPEMNEWTDAQAGAAVTDFQASVAFPSE